MRSKKAFKNTVYSLLFEAVAILAGFVVPRAMIEAFGSAEYGLTVSIAHFLGYLTLLQSGIGGVVRAALYKPLAEGDREGISRIVQATEHMYRMIAIGSLFYMAFLAAVFPLIVREDWGFGFTAAMVAVIGLNFFGKYFFGSPYQLLVTADQKGYIRSKSMISATVVSTVLVIAMIRAGAPLPVVMLCSTLVFLGRAFLLNRYVKKRYGLAKPAGKPDSSLLKQRWAGIGHSAARFIHKKTDILVITLFMNLQTVAVYSVYALVTTSLNMLVSTIVSPVQAAFGDIIAKGEESALRRNFNAFETLVHMMVIVLFSSGYALILPFMELYTATFAEGDYIRPLFAALLLSGEMVYCLRLPYDTIIAAAGKYRETRNGAFFEAGINLAVSMLLVWSLGIVGVAIGTLLSIAYRYAGYAYFLHSHVLRLEVSGIVRRLAVTLSTAAAAAVCGRLFVGQIAIASLGGWILCAFAVTIGAGLFTCCVHLLLYRREFFHCLAIVKNIARRK